jgi:endoglucanase
LKKLLGLSLIVSLIVLSCPSDSDNKPKVEPPPETALEYFTEKGLTAGWNLGNTFDSATEGGAQGGVLVNQDLLDGISSAGFNLIRIPVTWRAYMGPAPDYTINPERLARLAEVIEMAHQAGLVSIINIHHDGASGNNNNVAVDRGWLSIRRAVNDITDKMNITTQFYYLWKQVAEYFKDCGDWLMFESMNEIHDGFWGGGSFRGNPYPYFEVLNEWNQVFTTTVRATGGNNATRLLVIPSYCTIPECTYPGGKVPGHSIDTGSLFQLPEDSVPGRLVVTFHYYKPDGVGLGGGNGRPAESKWGTPLDRQEMDEAFKPFKSAYIDKGIPVIIGETGASVQAYPDDPETNAQAHASRLAYLSHLYGTAHKYGLVAVYWDNGRATPDQYNGEGFGLFDRATGEPNSEISRECIETMINAIGGNDD